MAYPTAEHYIFNEGLDPTGVWGAQASPLLETTRLAVPNSYRGMVIFSATAPAVTGQPSGYPANWYAWQKRCLWINTSNAKTYRYIETVGWVNVANSPDDGQLSPNVFGNGTIPIVKLVATGLADNTIMRVVNEIWTTGTIVNSITNGTLPIARLEPPAAESPAGSYVMVTTPGGARLWVKLDAALLAPLLQNGDQGLLTPRVLIHTGNEGDIFGIDVTERPVCGTPNSIFKAKSIDWTKIAIPAGNQSRPVYINSTGDGFETRPDSSGSTPNIIYKESATLAVPSPGNVANFTHGLPERPNFFWATLICKTTDAGYPVGYAVGHGDIFGNPGGVGSQFEMGMFSVGADATHVFLQSGADTNHKILHASTRQAANWTAANWDLKLHCQLIKNVI